MMAAVATLDDFARMADQVAATTSKREKVRLLSGFLRDLAGADLVLGTRYATGTVFAVGDPRTLQVGGAAFQNVLQEVGGVGPAELAGIWRRHADIGRVTGDVLRMSARSAEPLTLQALDAAFAAMAAASGARAKTAALRELLSSTTPDAGRYVAKLISGEMRIGLREGLVEEAIGVAFDAPAAAVSRAVMLVATSPRWQRWPQRGGWTVRSRDGSCRCASCSPPR